MTKRAVPGVGVAAKERASIPREGEGEREESSAAAAAER